MLTDGNLQVRFCGGSRLLVRSGSVSRESLMKKPSDEKADPSGQGSPLYQFRDQFDAFVARMQTPQAQKAADAIATATPEELGQAALNGFQRDEIETGSRPDSDPH